MRLRADGRRRSSGGELRGHASCGSVGRWRARVHGAGGRMRTAAGARERIMRQQHQVAAVGAC